jgi:hypothetical protein
MTSATVQHLWDACGFLALPLGFALLYLGLFAFLWFKKALRCDWVQWTAFSLVVTAIAGMAVIAYLGSTL